VDHPAVGAYWQPPVGASHHDAVTGLEQVLPWVDAVHVFSWWPGEHRLALDARAALWRSVADVLHGSGRQYDALLEFVRDDDPAQVRTDAATLTELIV
jgi:3-dehydroshikimate dehydratase